MQPILTDPKSKVDLGTVQVTTKEGDEYSFPAMDKNALAKVLPKGENRVLDGTPTLALCNASYSVLTIPMRIVKSIKVDGEQWWDCPA